MSRALSTVFYTGKYSRDIIIGLLIDVAHKLAQLESQGRYYPDLEAQTVYVSPGLNTYFETYQPSNSGWGMQSLLNSLLPYRMNAEYRALLNQILAEVPELSGRAVANYLESLVLPLDRLPNELLLQMALEMDDSSLSNFCRGNRRFNDLICDNDYFWHLRFIQEFDFDPKDYTGSWKDLYQNFAQIWTFGSNNHGQLGIKSYLFSHRAYPVMLNIKNSRKVVAGYDRSAIIDADHNLYVMGDGSYGKLGVPENRDNIDQSLDSLKVRTISFGEDDSALITPDNSLYSFGRDPIGGRQGRLIYVDRPQRVGLAAKDVALGRSHALILDLENNVRGWGTTRLGQLGAARPYHDYPIVLPGVKARKIAAGGNLSAVIDFDDQLWLFGRLESGIQPDVPKEFRAKDIAVGRSHLVLIDLEDQIWTLGTNHDGQLGLDLTIQYSNQPLRLNGMKAKKVAVGDYHTVVLDLDNNVWVFGSNRSGQLGLSDFRGIYPPTMLPGFKASDIAAGSQHTLLIGMKELW